MGLSPKEVKALHFKDFNLLLTGYSRRKDNEWNHTRHIMWSMINFGGMGLKETISPQQIWPLAIDIEDEKRMITNLAQAIELLNEFTS